MLLFLNLAEAHFLLFPPNHPKCNSDSRSIALSQDFDLSYAPRNFSDFFSNLIERASRARRSAFKLVLVL